MWPCGVQKDGVMNGVTSWGADERAGGVGAPLGLSGPPPPQRLLSGPGLLSTCGASCQDVWMSRAAAPIIFIISSSEGRQAPLNFGALFADGNRCRYQSPDPRHPHDFSPLSPHKHVVLIVPVCLLPCVRVCMI